jgi:hypothetical protein
MHANPLTSSRHAWALAPIVFTLAVTVSLTGCNRRSDTPTVGIYRAVLELPGGDAPFGLEVARANGAYQLYLVNGGERAELEPVTVTEGELKAQLSSSAMLTAAIYRDRLEGSVALLPGKPRAATIPFRASLGASYRFYAEPATDNADVEGRWRVRLVADGRGVVDGAAKLEQRFDRVIGTITTTTGAAHRVEGQVNGDDVALAAFDGETALLYKLRVDDAGNLVGEFWQNLDEHGQLRANRDTNATL